MSYLNGSVNLSSPQRFVIRVRAYTKKSWLWLWACGQPAGCPRCCGQARRGCPQRRHVHSHLRSGQGRGDSPDGFPKSPCRGRVLVPSTGSQFVHLRRCCLRDHRILPIHPPSSIETLHDFHALLRHCAIAVRHCGARAFLEPRCFRRSATATRRRYCDESGHSPSRPHPRRSAG